MISKVKEILVGTKRTRDETVDVSDLINDVEYYDHGKKHIMQMYPKCTAKRTKLLNKNVALELAHKG